MNYRHALAALTLVSVAIVCGAHMQMRKPTIVRKEVSLKSGGKEINAVTLENTHSRSYTDQWSGNRCDLTEKAEGVIWSVVCEGKDVPADDISLQDEQGRKFNKTCWNRQGTINGVAQTSFLAYGPDDSKKVKVIFGDASVEIEIPK